MSHRNNSAGADVLGRWRILAEQRLDYLTQLFESGRWRRYYGENAFLENIREAKSAVDAWRDLSTTNSTPARPMHVTWPVSQIPLHLRLVAEAPAIAASSTETSVAEEAGPAPITDAAVAVDMAALEQALDTVEQVLDLSVIEQRYPVLRNAM